MGWGYQRGIAREHGEGGTEEFGAGKTEEGDGTDRRAPGCSERRGAMRGR